MLIRFFYSVVLFIISPFFIYSLYKTKPNKPQFGKRWKEHFGITPALSPNMVPPIWIHAVSVGEVVAVTPLIKKLKAQAPELNIIVTTTTSTGANEANKLGVKHRYMPLDFPFAINRFLEVVKPIGLFIMETELWPNTLASCQQRNIPVTIINARLSARSESRYKKLPFVFDLLLKNIDFVLAQTKEDAARFIQLGLLKKQVTTTGSIKFDITATQTQKSDAASLRNLLGEKRHVWIAASTHKGEDEQIIKAHQQVLTTIPTALLIIVPRHPERFESVRQLVVENNLSVITRSSQKTVTSDTQVYLGDSMGEMMTLLGAADVCFIAGSLIGNKVGGHNLLEAAALKKPLLNGPSYFNFKEITEQLVRLTACKICDDSDVISASLLTLFNDKTLSEKQGEIAFQFVKNNQGALLKTMESMNQIMKSDKH